MRLREVIERCLELMRHGEWDDALVVLNEVLTEKMLDPWTLFLMGTCHREKGNDGLAYALLLQAMEGKKDFFEAMVNISPILREMGQHEQEIQVWKMAEALQPDHPDLLHNVAGAYLNNGTPKIAEEYALRSIEKEGKRPDNLIQLSLAYLEQERFGEGFDIWDEALKSGERKFRNFSPLGQTPMWDGNPVDSLVIFGEQGHGDEICFASCIDQAIELCGQVYIDTSKANLAPIYERSFPQAKVFCTPDSQIKNYHVDMMADAMIPFGSLPTLFRREKKDFPKHDGYIVAHPVNKRLMRERLDELGSGLKIGLAWKGGVKKTHSCYRDIDLVALTPILKQDGVKFISVQYTESAGAEASIQQDTTGVEIHHWQSVVDDFDMLTALIDELDLIISVPQTAVHQAGALGKECWVMTHSKVGWQFAGARDNCIWYPKQTRLFRRKEGDKYWDDVIDRMAKKLAKRTGSAPGGKTKLVPPIDIESMDIQSLGI